MGDELYISDDFTADGVEGLVLSPEVVDLDSSEPDGRTDLIQIRWIAADGDLFDLDDEGGEFSLQWEWGKPNLPDGEETCSEQLRVNPDLLDEIRPANLEMEDSWQFRFRADHAGSDQLQFRLMHGHGDHAHSDFVSRALPVVVAHADHPQVDDATGIYNHESDRCRTK